MKRIIGILSALLLLPSLANATITVVNVVSSTTTTLATLTETISIAAGHTVVFCAYNKNGTGALGTVTDSSGTNIYTIANTTNQPTNFTEGCGYSFNIATAVTSVTYTASTGAAAADFTVWDVTATGGTLGAGGAAGTAYNFNSPATTDGITTGNLTLTTVDGMLFASTHDGSSGVYTAGTGFTSDSCVNLSNYCSEHKAVTATAPATFTQTSGGHLIVVSGLALQVTPPVVVNGVLISNGAHPVQSGTAIVYQ